MSVRRTVERALTAARWQAKHQVEQADVWAERWIHDRRAHADAERFAEVERFCLFVGFPRSGGSLVGAMLDAHPDVVIAHEMGVLRKVQRGYSRNGLFAAALQADRRFAERGWANQDDVFAIPGQWQGRVRRLRVIGEKNAGETGRLLLADPQLLDRLADTVAVPLRVVVVVRNPLDNVARIARRGSLPVLTAAARYAEFAQVAGDAIDRLGDAALVVHHEATVADPVDSLHRLAAFLDVDADDGWVDACAALVLPSPRLARDTVAWSPAERAAVGEMVERFAFLRPYAEQISG